MGWVMAVKATVTGLPDLKAALAGIVPKLRRRALRSALAAGALLVRNEARARTPSLKTSTYSGASALRRGVRSVGTVKRAIVVRTSKIASRRGDVGVFVNVKPAPRGSRGAKNPQDPFYWRFINFDTVKRRGSRFLEAGASKLGQALEVFKTRIGPAIQKLNGGKDVQL